ncbi:MAG TPA: sulfocyanin-like copper-binding protein [bacterium]|nr:sulfocyanin-like copper-binding protein [bacterium]
MVSTDTHERRHTRKCFWSRASQAAFVAFLLLGTATTVLGAGTVPPVGYDGATHTVSLSLTAAQADAYNFNGYAGGALVVKVPTGSTVQVTMRNVAADVSHSVLVAPWDQRTKGSGFTPAFPGAAPADFETGITSHDPPLHFTFSARSAGTYALLCGVPGHALIGMWDELDVVDGLSAPSATTK